MEEESAEEQMLSRVLHRVLNVCLSGCWTEVVDMFMVQRAPDSDLENLESYVGKTFRGLGSPFISCGDIGCISGRFGLTFMPSLPPPPVPAMVTTCSDLFSVQ